MNDACSKPSDICVITNTIKYKKSSTGFLLINSKSALKMSMSVTDKKFYKAVSNEIDAFVHQCNSQKLSEQFV